MYLLSDKETNSVRLPGLEQLDNVGVIKRSKDVDLVLERFVVRYSRLLHRLDSNFLA